LLRSTHELVVTDAGPLMALGRHDVLGLLPALFRQVHVPELVLRECLTRPELPDAQRIQAALTEGWLCVRDVPPWDMRGLDLGERCAIGMALDLGAVLLVDDRAARRHAEALGLSVLGTLGVLVLAKRRGLLEAVRPLVQDMRDGGHFISQVAFEAVLQAAGEAG
jgi:predicted nucleic acid-binding protein